MNQSYAERSLIPWNEFLVSPSILSTASSYFKKLPSTAKFVLISFYKNNNANHSSWERYKNSNANHGSWESKEVYLNSSYRYGTRFENIVAKLKQDCRNTYYRFIITNIETYDRFRSAYNDNITLDINTLVSYNLEGIPNIMTSSALALEDQTPKEPVWGVFNLTENRFISQHPTEESAVTAASTMSRSRPTHRLLIMKPAKVVYQPIQVMIDDL